MRIWGFREIAPPLGRGDIPETPQIRIEKPLQLYYLGIRLVNRQSCTHTPISRVRTPPELPEYI